MSDRQTTHDNSLEWFAIKTRQDFRAEAALRPLCEEVYFPKEYKNIAGKKSIVRAIIPHVLFIRTTRANALALEANARRNEQNSIPFWIYRYPNDNRIQPISPRAIELLRLLTADDTTRCEIFCKKDFKENEHVRITGGFYKGLEGYVQRVHKNKHVIVKIEGICLVMLPFIHPDLLEPIE
ncbi:MAG: hypothetical protein K2L32_03340 [Muribaculaceae bacterium]|nr:hypothetical protein [Muribaculaceae bacterium]